MNAAVLHERGVLRVEVNAVPVPAPDEILLRVTTAGVCGTDVGEYQHGPFQVPLTVRNPWSKHIGPMILGHEFSGEVVQLGACVDQVSLGDVVASGSGVSCGNCRFRTAGRTNLCERYWTVGLHRDGGLAEYCAVPARVCLRRPSASVTEDAMALTQPMSIAIHAIRRAAPRAGSSVAVVGAGGVGAFIIAALPSISGVSDIVTIEPDSSRRAAALALGSREAHSAIDGDAYRVGTVFEVSGTSAGLATALELVDRAGTIAVVGLQRPHEAAGEFLRAVTFKELSVVGPSAHVFAQDFGSAVDVISKRRDWEIVAPWVQPLTDVTTRLGGVAPVEGWPIKTLFDPRIDLPRLAKY